MTASVNAQQATLTPIEPIESKVVESGVAPSRGPETTRISPTTALSFPVW